MEIHNIGIKTTLEEAEGDLKFTLYRDGSPISDDRITEEEIKVLEQVVSKYRQSKFDTCTRKTFVFITFEEAKAFSNSLMKNIKIESIIAENKVIVYDIRNIKLAKAHILQHKFREITHSV